MNKEKKMFWRRKLAGTMAGIFLLAFCMMGGQKLAVRADAKEASQPSEALTQRETDIAVEDGKLEGWVKEGNFWYYYKNGRPLKNVVYKIKNSYYWFDKQGRRKSGYYKDKQLGFTMGFSKTTRKCTVISMPLIVQKVGKDSFLGYSYTAENPSNRYTYRVSTRSIKLVDAKGKPMKASSLKKGNIVRVFVKKPEVRESYPAQLVGAYKIQMISYGLTL